MSAPEHVGIFLVDPRGWVLLQERDEHAPTAPGQWGIVGGHVEEGEDWQEAMQRELFEETGLELPQGVLRLWFEGTVTPAGQGGTELSDHWQIWAGRGELTDDDIVVGEGRQIVFVDPARLDELDLAESTAYFLPLLLDSPAYAELVDGTGQRA
jgi:8-oxo-dGTP diphosphatase